MVRGTGFMGAGRHRSTPVLETLFAGALCVLLVSPAAAQSVADSASPIVQSGAAALQVAGDQPLLDMQTPLAPQRVVSKPRDGSALRQAIIATVAGNVFDGVTTIVGVSSGSAREVNPLLGQTPGRIILMKTLFTLPQVLAEKHLVDTGHPTTAKWVGYVVGGLAAAVAIHNVQVISH